MGIGGIDGVVWYGVGLSCVGLGWSEMDLGGVGRGGVGWPWMSRDDNGLCGADSGQRDRIGRNWIGLD